MTEDAEQLVREYEDAESDLNDFIRANPDLLGILSRLASRRNALLERLEKLAKTRSTSLGPIKKVGTTHRVDPEALVRVVGEARFAEIGGETEVKRHISIAGLRKAVTSGRVAEHEANQAIEISARFTVPPTIRVPGGDQ